MQEISRFSAPSVEIVCTNSPATSHRIPFAHASGGVITISSPGSASQIQWHAAPSATASPVPIFADGATVTTTITTGAHPFPDSTFGCHTVVPVIAGAGTMQATVTLKG